MSKLGIIFTILVTVIVLGGIVGGIIYFNKSTKAEVKTQTTSDDGLIEFGATFYDGNGNTLSSGLQQSILGTTYQQADYISFNVKATNTGTVGLIDIVIQVTGGNLADSFSNKGNPPEIASLPVGATNIFLGETKSACSISVDCDTKESCVASQCLIALSQYETQPQPTGFSVQLGATYYDALGNAKQIISSPATLSYEILKEECIDGTPINMCNTNDKPKYCQFTSGTAPTLINSATTNNCGCPLGYEISGENCVIPTCTDGTNINTFASGYNVTTKTRNYCTSTQVLEPRCQQALVDLGTIVEACQKNFYNNTATGCNPATSGVVSTCVFIDYQGNLSGGIQSG